MKTLIDESADLSSLYVKERDLLDLELLLNGDFFPLQCSNICAVWLIFQSFLIKRSLKLG